MLLTMDILSFAKTSIFSRKASTNFRFVDYETCPSSILDEDEWSPHIPLAPFVPKGINPSELQISQSKVRIHYNIESCAF
jgi:hypothetical protein